MAVLILALWPPCIASAECGRPGGGLSIRSRIEVYWEARSSALLRHTAGSLGAGAVHRRGVIERVLLLTGILLSSFAVLSGKSSTMA